jgi:hypothetical protein
MTNSHCVSQAIWMCVSGGANRLAERATEKIFAGDGLYGDELATMGGFQKWT